MGSSCFLHSLTPPSSTSISSPSLSLSSRPIFFYIRNAESRRRISKAPMASMRLNSSPQDLDSCRRKALVILGVSIVPFLTWRIDAFEAFASEIVQGSGMDNQTLEETGKKSAPSNPFVSLLNALGILVGGGLAALYFSARKDNAESESTIVSLNTQLKEKDAAMFSLKKDLESANSKITGLGRELQNEKSKIEGAQAQIGVLKRELEGARNDKQTLEDDLKEMSNLITGLQENISLLKSEMKQKEEDIERLSSSLVQKDSELTKLDAIYKQTSEKLDALSLEIAKLRDELLRNQNELREKNLKVDDLNSRVESLTVDRDSITANLNTLRQEYDELKSSSVEKAASDAEILAGREKELSQLQESYEIAVSDASAKEAKILDLTQERNDLKEKLNVAEKTLESSRNEASDLNTQLNESKKVCSQLEDELSEVKAKFSRERDSLEKSLDDAKLRSEKVSEELTSANEALDHTKDKLQTVSNELATTSQNRDTFQKELINVQKKVETLANHLEDEKKIIATLNERLESSENLRLKEEELRRTLEEALNVASKNIDHLTKDVITFSNKLEASETRVSDLEEENKALSDDLEKERMAGQQAQKSLEDAHSLVMKLGNERERFEKRAEKLKQDLSSAKGEILRLIDQINSSKATVNGAPKEKSEAEQPSKSDTEPTPAVSTNALPPVKRTTRKRRANSQ